MKGLYKNEFRKVLAVVAAVSLVASQGVYAEDTATKKETVYVFTDAEGKQTDIIVNEKLENILSGMVGDETELTDIVNLKGDETFEQGENGAIEWDSTGENITYQGTTQKETPVDIHISYTLDGKEVAPEDLAGASGHLVIRYDYTNKEKQTVKIGDQEEEVYVPFTVLSGMLFDEGCVSNVSVNAGKVIEEGNRTIVVGVACPGLSDSIRFDEIKDKVEEKKAEREAKKAEEDKKKEDKNTENKEKADDKKETVKTSEVSAESDSETEIELPEIDFDIDKFMLPEYMEVEMDVNDFSMSMSMSLITNNLLDNLDLPGGEESEKITEIVDALTESGQKLQDGSQALADGIEELYNKVPDLTNGVGELADGIVAYTDGVAKVSDGVSTLKDGSSKLASGADKLATGADTLASGAGTLATGTNQLANGAEALKDGSSKLADGAKNAKAGADQLKNGSQSALAGVKQYNAGVMSALSQVGDAGTQIGAGAGELYKNVLQLQASLQGYKDAEGKQVPGAAVTLTKSLDQLIAQLSDSGSQTPQSTKDYLNTVDVLVNNALDAANDLAAMQSSANGKTETGNTITSEKLDAQESSTADNASEQLAAARAAADGAAALKQTAQEAGSNASAGLETAQSSRSAASGSASAGASENESAVGAYNGAVGTYVGAASGVVANLAAAGLGDFSGMVGAAQAAGDSIVGTFQSASSNYQSAASQYEAAADSYESV
ncbi:MAG: hypothetical protein Q4B47_06105, partial [Eubacteriales bacterium]|nr:hypothetical protein [Eubacteriales bacterium]